MSKKQKKGLKYGYLHDKEAEAIPWDRILVDLIGPYNIRREGHANPLIIKSLNMIYPATRWSEIIQHEDKQADK